MSLLPKPYSSTQSIATYEDPNKTCTWLFSNDKFSWVDVGEPDHYYSFEEAKQTCVELGKNKCNAVVGDASHSVARPSFIDLLNPTGRPTERSTESPTEGPTERPTERPTESSYEYLYLMMDCSMWQKWPSYYLYGDSLNGESHTTLAAAQESCYNHGPMCNAVKRKKSKYYLMQSQDIPSKKRGSWADYWVKLAATN